jgi:hypothetical protein
LSRRNATRGRTRKDRHCDGAKNSDRADGAARLIDEYEIRCYMRDPDGHLIEVGQTTDTTGDWLPAHWPSSASAEEESG